MTFGPTAGELTDLVADGLQGMPDIATVLRNSPTRTATGGSRENYLPVTTHVVTPAVRALLPGLQPGTTRCRIAASVLGGGSEQVGAGQLVSLMGYTLVVPPGTDIRTADRIQVGASTFEVTSGKTDASWNMSDAYTMQKIGD